MIGHKSLHSLQRRRGRESPGNVVPKIVFILYLLVNDNSPVKRDHDPRTGASTRRIGLSAKDTISLAVPKVSQAAVANTHLPVYRTYTDKSAPERYLERPFLKMLMGKVLFFSAICASFRTSPVWTVLLAESFRSELKRTDVDGKGPNSNGRVTCPGYYRRKGNLLAHAARFLKSGKLAC